MNARILPIFATVFLSAVSACLGAAPESIKVECGGVGFLIKSPNADENNTVTITPSGLGNAGKRITRAVDGAVGEAELADLDGDGTRELLLYIFTPGTGHYGDVVAYSTNGNKSLSEIVIVPPRKEDLAGYGGRDDWKPVKGGLLRSFPVYREGDPGAAPRGGMRKLKYTLHKGESSWQLVPPGVSPS